MTQLKIDENKCLRDGICSEVCPCKIFVADDSGLPHIDAETAPLCINCGHCVSICPANAISLDSVDGGQLPKVSTQLPDLNKFFELVQARRSIRSFKPELIAVEELVKLLEVTRWAPTAKNSQALSWVLVSGREKVQKISAAVIDVFRNDARMAGMVDAFDNGYDVIHRGAPHLAIAYGHEKYKWGTFDASIALNTLELAARAADVGTCWGGFSTSAAALDKSVGTALGISEENKIFAVLMLGRANFKFRHVPNRNELKLKIIS